MFYMFAPWHEINIMSKILRTRSIPLSCLFAVILLAACAISDKDLKESSSISDPYLATLHQEYLTLARQQKKAGDRKDSAHFAKKASDAAKEIYVKRDNPKNRNLNETDYPAVWAAHAWLKNLPAHVRAAFPKDTARAQVAFDCWIEQREEQRKKAGETSCEKKWSALVEQLECPNGCNSVDLYPSGKPADSYEVTFDLNDTSLDQEAQDTIRKAVGEVIPLSEAVFFLTGYTDRTGTSEYNLKLAQKRTQQVSHALKKAGVNEKQIMTHAKGESGQFITTDDDVKLKANRRVKIDVFRRG